MKSCLINPLTQKEKKSFVLKMSVKKNAIVWLSINDIIKYR